MTLGGTQYSYFTVEEANSLAFSMFSKRRIYHERSFI